MQHGAYQEGKAAAKVLGQKADNPYAKLAQEREGSWIELSSDWLSGFVAGCGERHYSESTK